MRAREPSEIRWQKHLDTLLDESAKSIGKKMGPILFTVVMALLALITGLSAGVGAVLGKIP